MYFTVLRVYCNQALAGVTRNAAAALGLQDEIGTLEVGKAADLCVWQVGELAELSYHLGLNRLSTCFRCGVERTSGTRGHGMHVEARL